MILNYQIQQQLLEDWCWAAVASSISFKYNPNSNWTQSRIAGTLLDPVCSNIVEGNTDNAPSICQQPFSLEAALACTRNRAWKVDRQLTLDEIIGQINGGWPLCCQIHWDDVDKSHFVTIYGYSGNTIIIGDPEAGACSLLYEDLITGYRTGSWVRTIGTQPVL
jgi:hypothetical protein